MDQLGIESDLSIEEFECQVQIDGLIIRWVFSRGRSIKRGQVPVDLVGSMTYLLSPDRDFMTGQTMVIDGGSRMI